MALRLVLNLNKTLNSNSSIKSILRSFSMVTPKLNKSDKPVKFTTTEASKVKISETLEYSRKVDDTPKYQGLVVAFSVAAFLIYFCILREENDIDEILKGNPDYQDDYRKLVDLKFKLWYAQKNNMPTGALLDKIEELQSKMNKR